MKTNQKGIVQLLLVIGIVVALGVIGYAIYANNQTKTSLSKTKVPKAYQAQYQQSADSVAPIQNSSDLGKAAASLDTTSTTEIDTHLNALNSASSGF